MTVCEICVEGAANAAIAAEAGADRVELCAALSEGGLTPTPGMLAATLRAVAGRSVSVPVMVMLRARGGGFVFSDQEAAAMRDDAGWIASSSAAGVVTGCLTPAHEVDVPMLRGLVAASGGKAVTFHRAFDQVRDPAAALEALVACGVSRVLTSGLAADGVAGIPVLRRLVGLAAGRIAILACGGLRPGNVARVRDESGATELHFAAPLDGNLSITDPELAAATLLAARA